jgi:hypothetical protein
MAVDELRLRCCAQFTCFTGTKVQILTQKALKDMVLPLVAELKSAFCVSICTFVPVKQVN